MKTLGKFKRLGNAEAFSSRTLSMSAIVMGDDGQFWVVTLAAMQRLLAAGFEVASND